MDDPGRFVGGVFCLAMFALFALLGWKFWQGKWLNFIAGNNFVAKEEMQTPYQRDLGRHTAVVMACCCMAILLLAATTALPVLAGDQAHLIRPVLITAAIALILVPCIWLVVWSNRRARKEQDELVAADPSQADNVRFERKQALVCLVILGGMLAIYLVVIPLAKAASS